MKNALNNYVFRICVYICLAFFCTKSNKTVAQTNSTLSYTSEFVGEICRLQTIAKIKGENTQYIGRVIKDDGREVAIVDEFLGLVIIRKDEVLSLVVINDDDLSVGSGISYVPKGAFTTRNVFTTNAFNIEKGKHYAMFNLQGPEFHLAINSHLNVGVMTTWIASPVALVSKYSFTNDESKVKFSIGGIVGNSFYINQFASNAGIGFATLTFGKRQNNFSISAGYGFYQDDNTRFQWIEPGTYSIEFYNPYLYNDQFFYQITEQNPDIEYSKTGTFNGIIISAAGAITVGRNTSLIFDSMIMPKLSSSTGSIYNIESVEPSLDNPNNFLYQVTVIDDENSGGAGSLVVLMPGCRIQKTEKKAFQFAIAGVMVNDPNGDFVGFPIPLLSWFRGF
tara:strand:- start:468 stop:1646 length:1179 start_codon:yes stop_codon:yes gene_type:complete